MSTLLEVAIYGVALVWLSALVPAAIVTCLKQHWLLFTFGWLTCGVLWFVGALSIAPVGSFWARRFYDEEKLARAEDPLRHPRPLHRIALAVAGVIALIVLAGLFGARPAPVLGLGGRALERSVGNSAILTASPCTHVKGNTWKCSKWDDGGSSTVAYRVDVDGLGCWTATRAGPAGEGSARRLSGCVTLADYR